MSYQISSKAFDDPNKPELLKVLASFFQARKIDFYVVGAAARDIVMGMIYSKVSRRKTNDLDIAIMISNWDIFEEISAALCNLPDFKKSPRQKQRFHYKDHLILDIIPFGEVARENRHIYWPPDATPVMSVSGFVEMAKEALFVTIDNEFTVGVASIPGIFVLKLIAWCDRCKQTNKDAEDMASMLDEYFEINIDRAVEEHPDVFEAENFTTFTAGAVLLGRDVRNILSGNNDLLQESARIIYEQIDKAEKSFLIGQILETHRAKKYEEVHRVLTLLRKEIKG
jgi:predicted nucleotidyltransferase